MSEREAFEAWAWENGLQSHTDQSLDYPLGNVLWKCWQARAAVQANVPDGWQPIETAPDNMEAPVVVFWIDREGEKHHDFDYTEDGCWMRWHDHAEHVVMIGGYGVSYTPPYTHWMPLPPLSAIPKG